MTGRFILADLTSHKRGFGVQSAINAAARQAQSFNPLGKVIWIVPGHLAPAFAHIDGTLICDSPDEGVWIEIRRQVEDIRSRFADAEIKLVTWSQFINDRAQNSNLGIAAVKWFTWLESKRVDRPTYQPAMTHIGVQGNTDLPSAEEIEKIVIDYLRSVGALSEGTALYRSRLRPNLARAPRLERIISGPVFGFTLKEVIASAVKRGTLGQGRSIPGQEKLWVIERTSQIVPPAAPEARQEAVVSATVSTDKTQSDPVYARSAEFRKRLTDLGIFCEKRERDILLEALKRLLSGGPQPLSRLRRELPQVAHRIVVERSIDCKTEFKRIVNFFLKLMLVAGALVRSDGAIIRRDLGSEAAEVAGFVESTLDVIELYMLEQILRKSDVKDRESWQLALALFRQFDQSVEIDGMLDRVAVLTSKLVSRFILTDDGTYEFTEPISNIVKMRA